MSRSGSYEWLCLGGRAGPATVLPARMMGFRGDAFVELGHFSDGLGRLFTSIVRESANPVRARSRRLHHDSSKMLNRLSNPLLDYDAQPRTRGRFRERKFAR